MLPDWVRIAPPAFDAIAAYGIGGLAVVVAALFVALVSTGARPVIYSDRALVMRVTTSALIWTFTFSFTLPM